MAWIPLYINKQDEKDLLDILNQEEQIAFLVSNGKGKWIAVKSINQLLCQRVSIWHIPSGKLPLLTQDDKEEWIQDPFNGWTEKRKGADESTPYFGAGWPGIINLNINTNDSSVIGMSSFEWIGNHYSIIGITANESTKKFWNKLRRLINKKSSKLPRSNEEWNKPEIFTFQGALKEIENGKERNINP
tara:strand:- start:62 stop:625 length:564 start_codon:yes stop_codon:yes gene_type:complete